MKKRTYKYKEKEYQGLIEFLRKEIFTKENGIRLSGVFLLLLSSYVPKILIPIPKLDVSYGFDVILFFIGAIATAFGPYIKTIIFSKMGVVET